MTLLKIFFCNFVPFMPHSNATLQWSTNWTEFDVRGGLAANVQSANPVFESVNITSVAANQSAVYIRFHKYAASHYYWAIDDVAIVEGPADNLTLTRAKVDFNYPGGGFYSRIPVSQAAETSLGFEAMVENDGSNAQTGSSLTVEVKDGSGATRYLETGPAKAIAVSTTDSLATTGSFTPGRGFGYTDVGNYTVNYTIVQDQADQVLADNVASLSYMLTDSVYARDNGVSGGNAAPDSYTCCTTDGSEVATLYEFTATETVTSVSVFVLGSTSPTGISVFGNLYRIDANNSVGSVPIAQSDIYDITTSDLGTWVTLAFTIPAVVQRDSAVLASIAVFGYDAGEPILILALKPRAEVTMKVFPNPLTHSATVLVGEQYQMSSVRIYSISGSIVTEKRGLSGNRVSIGIENLPGGMYFIEVVSEEGMQAREKVIIQ